MIGRSVLRCATIVGRSIERSYLFPHTQRRLDKRYRFGFPCHHWELCLGLVDS